LALALKTITQPTTRHPKKTPKERERDLEEEDGMRYAKKMEKC
jgi:hypothetical protein